jgi:hypothetical protein
MYSIDFNLKNKRNGSYLFSLGKNREVQIGLFTFDQGGEILSIFSYEIIKYNEVNKSNVKCDSQVRGLPEVYLDMTSNKKYSYFSVHLIEPIFVVNVVHLLNSKLPFHIGMGGTFGISYKLVKETMEKLSSDEFPMSDISAGLFNSQNLGCIDSLCTKTLLNEMNSLYIFRCNLTEAFSTELN